MARSAAKKILLVTSDSGAAEKYTSCLGSVRDPAMAVEHMPDLKSVVERLDDHEPDAILLDTGIENETNLADIARILSQGGHIPIVALVPSDDHAALNLLELGVQDYVARDDITGPRLAGIISKAIVRRRHENKLHQEAAQLREQEEELRDSLGRLERAHTELKMSQNSMADAERSEAIARLTAGVAHEVKNPLQIMRSGMDLIKMQLKDRTRTMNVAIEQMEEAINRANAIIMELLDFARPRELEATVQELNPIIEKSLLLMKNELAKNHIKLVTQFDAHVAPLRLNKTKIGQALINLFINAVHAMRNQGGGELTVISRMTQVEVNDRTRQFEEVEEGRGESAVIVQIMDTGPGINEALLQKVLEPFFSTKSEGEGTGLGLSVTRKIMQLHGGDLYIANRETGGAMVTLLFRDFYPDLSVVDVYSDSEISEDTVKLPVAVVE